MARISSKLENGLARSSSSRTSASFTTNPPGPRNKASVKPHRAIVCPKFPHCRHCSRCPTFGCLTMMVVPNHRSRTIPSRKVGHPASLNVTLQIVDVREFGVCVSRSSISNSVGMLALKYAAILPTSLKRVRLWRCTVYSTRLPCCLPFNPCCRRHIEPCSGRWAF